MLTDFQTEQLRNLFDTVKLVYANSKRNLSKEDIISQLGLIKNKCAQLENSLSSSSSTTPIPAPAPNSNSN